MYILGDGCGNSEEKIHGINFHKNISICQIHNFFTLEINLLVIINYIFFFSFGIDFYTPVLFDMQCSTGYELAVLQCDHISFGSESCNQSNDVAVTCCEYYALTSLCLKYT